MISTTTLNCLGVRCWEHVKSDLNEYEKKDTGKRDEWTAQMPRTFADRMRHKREYAGDKYVR